MTTIADVATLALLATAGFMTLRVSHKAGPPLGWRARMIRMLPLLAFAEAVWFAQFAWDRLVLLAWGSDQLTYESLSRDILFHGPLMTLGVPVGHGAPYYY